MEKRFTLALVLSLVVLVCWQIWFGPKPQPKKDEEKSTTAKPEPGPGEAGEQGETKPGGVEPGGVEPGGVAPGPDPKADRPADAEQVTLRNDKLEVRFSSFGAVVDEVQLLDFRPNAEAAESEHLKLLVPSEYGLNAFRIEDRSYPDLRVGRSLWTLNSSDERHVEYTREFTRTFLTREKEAAELTYTLRKRFTLPADDARYLEFKIEWEYTGGRTLKTEFALLVTGGVFQEIGGESMSEPRSAIFPFEDDVEIMTVRDVADDDNAVDVEKFLLGKPGNEKTLERGNRFVADVSNYHGAFLLLKDFPDDVGAAVFALLPYDKRTGKGNFKDRNDGGSRSARTCTVLNISASTTVDRKSVWKGLYYLGPVEDKSIDSALGGVLSESEIESLGEVYDDQLSWARPIARVVQTILSWWYSVFGNWGWSIIALTLCVRVALFPINRKSQAAMMHVQEAQARVKPKLEKLKEKHKDDQKKFHEEQMKLYRAENVPLFPIGGCLPMFLQIPIFFGLFSALRASIDLRQAEWLWVADLSQPDHLVTFDSPMGHPLALCGGCCPIPSPDITGFHILPILMTVAWVLNSYFMPKPEVTNPQMEQQRKMMMFMPLLFGVFMYTYAAGLSLYWLTSSLIGIVESRVIKKIWPVKKPGEKEKVESAATT